MRFHYSAALIMLASLTPASACEINWPSPNIAVPGEVERYIVSECKRYKGFAEESVAECIRAEKYGYRAEVMMLSDPVAGDAHADRYRTCQVGLGDLGGRFHRRRAECMATVDRIVWRFEFMQEASAGVGIRFAQAN